MAVTLILFGSLLLPGNFAQSSFAQGDGCKVVERALKAALELTPGMIRADVEKHFKEDGGGQFNRLGRFVYRECGLIKIEVDFDVKNERGFSKDDKIVKVSRPYIEYGTKD
ncbi:MAG: hypothetical protein L0Z53_14645 [Acidobacteriales bacterium]|nr:hypothetical protein [Terriglobales bacterium]